jgi:hypothetical protein
VGSPRRWSTALLQGAGGFHWGRAERSSLVNFGVL